MSALSGFIALTKPLSHFIAWRHSTSEVAMRKKRLLQNTLFAAIVACAVYVLHAQTDADVAALSTAVASSQNW